MLEAVLREIERQASEAWGMGQAIAAVDYMRVVIPAVPRRQSGDDVDGHGIDNDDEHYSHR